jgi:predicted AAA+ superfamily ATPase
VNLKCRYLSSAVKEDALRSHKMAFISGPRQVGKTTLAKALLKTPENYFTWDDLNFAARWVKSVDEALSRRGLGPVVLDEIHKDRKWKARLKGFFDRFGSEVSLVVTGSARLDLYRKGGDSLMGRYFPYRLHPFSVAESDSPIPVREAFRVSDAKYSWRDLYRLGGFPEPFLGGSEAKAKRWSRLRMERLVQEDVRDLRSISDLNLMRVLVSLLPGRVGSLLSINAIREDVGSAYGTIYEWLQVLEALYHHFLVRPYSGNLKRTLRAEPKLYLYDIIPIEDPGARLENLIALHLLKACHYWMDTAQGEFELMFIRTKEKEEVDFCVTRDKKPWLLVECKSAELEPTAVLRKFTRLFRPKWSFQLVTLPNHYKYFPHWNVYSVSYERFCAGLL